MGSVVKTGFSFPVVSSAPRKARSFLCCVMSEKELLRKARGEKPMCVQTASRYSQWRGSCVFGMAPALEYLCSV